MSKKTVEKYTNVISDIIRYSGRRSPSEVVSYHGASKGIVPQLVKLGYLKKTDGRSLRWGSLDNDAKPIAVKVIQKLADENKKYSARISDAPKLFDDKEESSGAVTLESLNSKIDLLLYHLGVRNSK